jgi:hypothetical protein
MSSGVRELTDACLTARARDDDKISVSVKSDYSLLKRSEARAKLAFSDEAPPEMATRTWRREPQTPGRHPADSLNHRRWEGGFTLHSETPGSVRCLHPGGHVPLMLTRVRTSPRRQLPSHRLQPFFAVRAAPGPKCGLYASKWLRGSHCSVRIANLLTP